MSYNFDDSINPHLYNFNNIPDISIFKTNKLSASLSKDVSLLIKHCCYKKLPDDDDSKMTILLIKNNTVSIDLEQWIQQQFKDEKHQDYKQKYEELIERNDIHYLNVASLDQINQCILQVQKTLLTNLKSNIFTKKTQILIFIIGLDMMWDTESFLLSTKKERISLLNNLFVNIRSLKEFQEIADAKVVIGLDEMHNIKANKSFSMSLFLQKFYMNQENVLLELDLMRREINKRLYTNNIICLLYTSPSPRDTR